MKKNIFKIKRQSVQNKNNAMMLQDKDESAQKFALLKPNAPQFKLKIKSSSYLKARQPLRQ